MRKLLLSTCVVATLATLGLWSTQIRAQAAPTAAAPEAPHKVGLIDMAEVFKGYEKFTQMTDALKEEVQATGTQMQAVQKEMQTFADEMKDLKKDSPRYIELERKILDGQAQLQLLKTNTQRDLARKEARIYKTVYTEVQAAVAKYAQYYNYTLIIRYSSEEINEDDEPQVVIHKLNRLVVYRRGEDDITRSVVSYLNKKHAAGN
jgi:Skp family chaperone for outer membrane proteins